MKVLIIGAGAVGLVYARHLQAGGAEVSLFVKEKYVAECLAGLWLHPLNGRQAPVQFVAAGIYSDAAALPAFDQVWLCMSSTAMRQPWLDDFLPRVGDAVVVSLQPGLADREYLLDRLPEDRVANGMIPFISFQSPLPGEERAPPGVAYWVPPLTACPFSGPAAPVDALVALLNSGGLKARRVANVPAQLAFGSALMMPIIAALEAAGWSFAALRERRWLRLGARGARQASAIAAPGRKRWLARRIGSPLSLRLILWIAPKLMPFDLEVYLRYHFTKVGDQTRDALALYLRRGAAQDLPTDALASLLAALRSA